MAKQKNIFDYTHVKNVHCAIIQNEHNELVGKIIANHSDNPNGSVCTVQVFLCDKEKYGFISQTHKIKLMNEWAELEKPMIGKAGGYGYDKYSAAIYEAIKNNLHDACYPQIAGRGMSAVISFFKEKFNLTIREII